MPGAQLRVPGKIGNEMTMRMNSAVPFLRFLGFSQGLARRYGVNAAILIAYVIDRLPDEDETAEIEASAEKIEAATTLSWRQIDTARKAAEEVLGYRHDRLSHRSFWRIDCNALRGLFTGGAVTQTHLPNLQNSNSGIPQTATRVVEKDLKGKVRGTPKRASAEASGIIQAFAAVYRERFRGAYAPHPKHDLEAAEGMLAVGINADGVSTVFRQATKTKGFWCSKVASLPELAKRWNDVQAEIEKAKPRSTEAIPGGQSTDEWHRELTTPAAVGGKATK